MIDFKSTCETMLEVTKSIKDHGDTQSSPLIWDEDYSVENILYDEREIYSLHQDAFQKLQELLVTTSQVTMRYLARLEDRLEFLNEMLKERLGGI